MSTQVSQELEPVSFTKVRIDDSFWAPRIRINREQTLPHEYRLCEQSGHIDALRMNWKPGMPKKPHIFFDSDLAKWIEAASYSLATHPDQELDALVDQVIELVKKVQRPDGYLNSYFVTVEFEKRWTNLRDNHELYSIGHLIEAAVAHFQATGKRSLLDVMCRCADHVDSVFGREPGKKRGYDGHEEIELALVKLYRVTKNEKYLKLSEYFVEERGAEPHFFDEEARVRGDDPSKYWHKDYSYCQAHKPVREQCEVTGHAVRAMYLYCAMADLAAELGDASLLDACSRLWRHATQKLMYVTGGIGTSRHNEGFTFDYDLPNESAYCETCAAIGLVFFGHRLLQIDCDSRYSDIIERALLNGVISGVSLDGRKFFYENPLASVGHHHRKEWFGCACCPPNIARLLASLGEYVYSQGEREAVIHLYVQGSVDLSLADTTVQLRQATEYPWDGKVRIDVAPARASEFALRLRIPGWCERFTVTVNGSPVSATPEKGYIGIERTWQAGDRVELELAMNIQRVYSNPKVRMNCGRVALQRGPIVYCLESVDNGADLNSITLPATSSFAVKREAGLLGGVVTITAAARRQQLSDFNGELYRTQPPKETDVQIKAIPYCTWDNRDAGEMLVWLREC